MTFTLTGFLIMLLIAAIAGALAQVIAGYSLGGLFASIAVGFIGALLGTWLADALNLPRLFEINVDGNSFPLIWAIIGGVIFALIVGMLRSPRRVYRTR